jgi:hypothetical protein
MEEREEMARALAEQSKTREGSPQHPLPFGPCPGCRSTTRLATVFFLVSFVPFVDDPYLEGRDVPTAAAAGSRLSPNALRSSVVGTRPDPSPEPALCRSAFFVL